MVDLGRYTIVLDGGEVGTVALARASSWSSRRVLTHSSFPVQPGEGVPLARFSIVAGEAAAFVCSPPSIPVALPRLVTSVLLGRGFWIDLGHAGHTETVGDGTSSLDGSEQDVQSRRFKRAAGIRR